MTRGARSIRRLAVLALAVAAVPLGAQAVFTETGVASWYGEPFHGRRTANGEVFDMRAMSAAHKSLPFGTLVRVTNVADGRSVVVRINDRGPFVAGRIIDLSKAAAAAIGLDRSGTARVEIREMPAGTALGPVASGGGPGTSGVAAGGGLRTAFPDGTSGAEAPARGASVVVRIQVGSYTDPAHARDAVDSLASIGLGAVVETAGRYHRVAVYVSPADKARAIATLDAFGWKDRLVTETGR